MTENLMGILDYDAELSLHNERLRGATGVGPADRVLDIGCGAGQTTRDAARAADSGQVLGVDVSAPMLERARQLSDEEGLNNITTCKPTPRSTASRLSPSTSVSVGSGRCSSLTPLLHSPTSGEHCAPQRAW